MNLEEEEPAFYDLKLNMEINSNVKELVKQIQEKELNPTGEVVGTYIKIRNHNKK